MENEESATNVLDDYQEQKIIEDKTGEDNTDNLMAIDNEGFPNNEVDDRTSQDSREHVITTQPNSDESIDYEDVYRAGNFGVTLGKVSQTRGLKWAVVHMGLTMTMLLLTVIGTALLVEYYKVAVLRGLAIGFTWSNSIVGLLSGILAVFFFRRLTKLRRPYAFLMTVRFMAIINWVLVQSTLHNSDRFYPDFCIFRTELLSPISFLIKCNTEKVST